MHASGGVSIRTKFKVLIETPLPQDLKVLIETPPYPQGLATTLISIIVFFAVHRRNSEHSTVRIFDSEGRFEIV
jgi:hypothetical protein